jgi:hypothetical protein
VGFIWVVLFGIALVLIACGVLIGNMIWLAIIGGVLLLISGLVTLIQRRMGV